MIFFIRWEEHSFGAMEVARVINCFVGGSLIIIWSIREWHNFLFNSLFEVSLPPIQPAAYPQVSLNSVSELNVIHLGTEPYIDHRVIAPSFQISLLS